ncbi:bifunctional hydroxymethylpyrimidine kinase/phosphomethylpyrimidine kinase [Teredinibacter waterburyi]|uniref:bifunctional hydroxymethylpyrimidine kinase/phosphomethylpyrimidine kinase n=1 Tax=Teredinibacter waterburyi TaxID=1500538 RepID=UPI00165F1FD8|nr:bifunctional hydroxymethylpyrimidine kinase/phosphomethylpyrimidine kinase [Teredinibacter waterburyi]
MLQRHPLILTIAGSDSFAGAGLQADIKTAAALNCYCCTVVTAITAQNSRGVSAVWPVSLQQLLGQLEQVLADITPSVIKLGMLANPEIVTGLASFLRDYRARVDVPLIVDTVLRSTTGANLLSANLTDYSAQILSQASLITPNLAEASALLGCDLAGGEAEMATQAQALLATGAAAVLLKGGHLESANASDCFVSNAYPKPLFFRQPRVDTRNSHGTGCTLATAISAYIAQGEDLITAIGLAKTYVSGALAGADSLNIVPENGPLNHFFDALERE